ncbi:MAG TPA: hypothetical protein VMA13_01905 [Candidatus Saccharimonadales bacterium]|nr:hypothetical protein [Candidatus Saccharimonadales bacterium]
MNAISQLLTLYGGMILFLPTFAEQSGVPIPVAPLLLVSGALAANGHLSLISAIAWSTGACILADAIWFCAGNRSKKRLLAFLERWHGGRMTHPQTAGVKATLHGMQVLTIAKFLPFGTLVPLRAGTLDIRLLKFVLVDFPASMIYAGTYLLLGFFFHHQLNYVMEIIKELGTVGLLLVVALVAIYVTYGLARHRHPASNITKVSNSRPHV